MTLVRPLLNLLLVLALVASGPLAAFAAEPAEQPPASAAPCHDLEGPAQATDGGEADCCSGETGYCGCDCLHHVAAAPLRLQRVMHPLPASPTPAPNAGTLPRSRATPDTRPPIA